MQMLFQEDQGRAGAEQVEVLFWRSRTAAPETRAFAQQVFREAVNRREVIDEMIRKALRNWKFDRLAPVDRSILRLAVAEALSSGTARAVVIDEAVEIARKYGGERSPDFVNGILDRILSDLERSTE